MLGHFLLLFKKSARITNDCRVLPCTLPPLFADGNVFLLRGCFTREICSIEIVSAE